MALVSYDFGSESDDNDTEEENKSSKETKNNEANFKDYKGIYHPTSQLFSNLPKTTIFEDVQEDRIEDFIPKSSVKEKQKVKITIPSLSQFEEDEEEPKQKKCKASTKGSGLMSLLPPVKISVKTEKIFIPHVIANKSKNMSTSKNSSVTTKNNTSVKINVQRLVSKSINDIESDDDDNDVALDLPETFDDDVWQKVCNRQILKPFIQEPIPEVTENIVNIAPETVQPYDGLDNKAFKELVGRTRRPVGNINLIDIHEEAILPDKDLWLTKSLTDPEMIPKDKIEDPVDPTRRKKHHITYLAQQAKANEKELQSAWAASKNNRLMSRAKYGF